MGKSPQSNAIWYPAVDLFKFIAALLVVVIHAHPFGYDAFTSGQGPATSTTYYVTSLCRIAVPFFFAISSFLFFKLGTYTIAQFVKRLLLLYVTWFVIELPVVWLSRLVSCDGIAEMVWVLIQWVLWRNTFYASWFISALIFGMLFTHYASRRIAILIAIMCAVIACLGSLYHGLLPDGLAKEFIHWFNPANSFVMAIPFCVMGRLVAESSFTIQRWVLPIGALASLALGTCEVVYLAPMRMNGDCFIALFPTTFLLLVVTTTVRFNASKSILTWCRKASILIYLLHCYLQVITKHLPCNDMVKFVALLIITLLSAAIILKLSKRYKLLKLMY
ncbi:MAG: acyltransferase [Muribaculaceae bacterium]|nr:acyltransferase [Muribaculaceae bacterium]